MKHYNNSFCKASQTCFSENLYHSSKISPFTPLGTSARMLIIVMLKRSIHNSLDSRFVLVFCLSFFLKGRHFVMLHRRFFYQIEKPEEMTLYLPGPNLFGSFVCCNVMHDLSRKVFCNILIQKFQNYTPRTGCLARYMSLF